MAWVSVWRRGRRPQDFGAVTDTDTDAVRIRIYKTYRADIRTFRQNTGKIYAGCDIAVHKYFDFMTASVIDHKGRYNRSGIGVISFTEALLTIPEICPVTFTRRPPFFA
jgi:hypothetical protein